MSRSSSTSLKAVRVRAGSPFAGRDPSGLSSGPSPPGPPLRARLVSPYLADFSQNSVELVPFALTDEVGALAAPRGNLFTRTAVDGVTVACLFERGDLACPVQCWRRCSRRA